MNNQLRYLISLVTATLCQLLAMAFLVIFMNDAITTADTIPATFALGSLYCQILALAFYFLADYFLAKRGVFTRSVPKPKRHYKEMSQRTFNTLMVMGIIAVYAVFMVFICQ